MAAKLMLRAAFVVFLAAACLFGAAGTVRWWNGWLFMLAYSVLVAILSGGFFLKSPDLVEERMHAGKRAKKWDRLLVPLLALILPLATLILAGLDRRFGWTGSFPTSISLAALPILMAASALTFRAMQVNPFFSSHVRIQADRGQTVIRRGPYRLLRHPGYTGAILFNLGVPVLLGSLAALWAGVAFMFISGLRTVLEDRTLRRELPGYEAYAREVRYRLVPFIW